MDGLASVYLKVAKQCGVKTTICHSHITRPEYSVKGIIKKILRKILGNIAIIDSLVQVKREDIYMEIILIN